MRRARNTMKNPSQKLPTSRLRRGLVAQDLPPAVLLTALALACTVTFSLIFQDGLTGASSLVSDGLDLAGAFGRAVLHTLTHPEACLRAIQAGTLPSIGTP